MNHLMYEDGREVQIGDTMTIPATGETLTITELPPRYSWNTYVRFDRADRGIVDVPLEQLGLAWSHPHRTDISDSGDWEEVEYKGLTFRVKFDRDDCHEASWESGDGYGIISDWTTRNKKPGERVIASGKWGAKRYYDWAATIKIAKRDGWNHPPYNVGTKGERAVRAVQADFEFHKAWIDNKWYFAVVQVECEGEEDALGGVETWKDYHVEQAWEMIESMYDTVMENRRRFAEAQAAAAKSLEELQATAHVCWSAMQQHYLHQCRSDLIPDARADFNRILRKAGLQPIAE